MPTDILERGEIFADNAAAVRDWFVPRKHDFGEDKALFNCVLPSGRTVTLRVHSISANKGGGRTLIRRYGSFELSATVGAALKKKLPKLFETAADRHILLLERDQWSLDEKAILDEVRRQTDRFSDPLSPTEELWFAETINYVSDGIVNFNRYNADGKALENVVGDYRLRRKGRCRGVHAQRVVGPYRSP